MVLDRSINNCVVIVAAGRGSRMQSATGESPKQYVRVGDRTVLSHAISTFLAMPVVDAILVVIHPDDVALYEASIPADSNILLPPAFGADDRQGSVLNGLRYLKKYSPKNVYIHDAARPFMSAGIMDALTAALEQHEGALPGLRVSDTLKRTEGMTVTGTIPREGLWGAQTPQAFRYERILAAHEKAETGGNIRFTDDASIAEWYGLGVVMVEGNEDNRKLTTPEDLIWAQQHVKRRMQGNAEGPSGLIRVGSGFDVHAFTEGNAVILCGVAIPHDQSLKGHSDADVAMHALTDALFGAIADGDIGIHFPPSDPKWKGAASHIFLEYAVERVRSRGGIIQNVDVTIICEMPKIGPHSSAMRERLSVIMGLPVDRISVKATTTERLGFTGRQEGIASMASATVWMPGQQG